jgi:hypothetical protein
MLWGSMATLKSRKRRGLKHLRGAVLGNTVKDPQQLLLAPILVLVLALVPTPFLAPSLADADADVSLLAPNSYEADKGDPTQPLQTL